MNKLYRIEDIIKFLKQQHTAVINKDLEELGISRQTLSNIYNNKTNVTYNTLVKLNNYVMVKKYDK